jgi:cellulose synthase/poly-beta-1,6-N-acetylglucosamine synthase-like glycosyltransferase
MSPVAILLNVLAILFIAGQVLYTCTFLVDFYFFTLPVNWVDPDEPIVEPEAEYPFIVLFYPVLRELESTMRTTMLSIARLDYPRDRFRVIAIPNFDDRTTIASLDTISGEFPFLEILAVPPTTDPSWNLVWNAWDSNPKAYWWHNGARAGEKALPPKKTRQLIYAFYHTEKALHHEPNLAINYIDADSAVPPDHFLGAVNGLKHYDVLQAQNVAGNLNASMAATWHAFDHMAWDGNKYVHLTANGRQPFWVLGKGLFFRASDLVALGGFHPWITIEDPEVGLRFWKNGKRLGVLRSSLIEEVPETIAEGIKQRKRWVCGFFQSLTVPLRELDFTFTERLRAWMIFLPCLSLWVNAIGAPTGIWALVELLAGKHVVPEWTVWLAAVNLTAFVVSLTLLYIKVWGRTKLVLTSPLSRLWYMLRINPISAVIWWVIWIIPLAIGFRMYLRDEGQVWQRTEKFDANHVRGHLDNEKACTHHRGRRLHRIASDR